MTAHPPTLGRWLKRLRAQQDLTQEALAELANCSVQTIRFFESGKRRPSVEMAEHLAEILQIPPEETETFIKIARTPFQTTVEPAIDPPMATAPVPGSSAVKNGVPSMPRLLAPNPLIGRETEVNILTRLLTTDRSRLVTLIGMGGMGKTLLALHVAHTLQTHFAQGAAFVPLASLTQASEIPAAIAKAMGRTLAKEPSAQAQLDALLADHELLLVLDNFEHLVPTETSDEMPATMWTQPPADDALAMLNYILTHHPTIRLLVTTRVRLRLQGEQSLELRGLLVGAMDERGCTPTSEAVLLFLQRATQVVPQMALTPDNQAAICQICTLLEGQPLAIELAAAWSHVLSPTEIAAEITRDLDFLARGDRNLPARHRSLRSVFEHSWRLLMLDEQQALAALAVFRGGFTRDAAAAVALVSLPLLAQLVDKSLIRVFMQPNATGEQTARYYIHNLLRVYLLEQLTVQSDVAAVYQRHAIFFHTLAEQATVELYAGHSASGLFQIGEELTNLRAALQWAVSEGHNPPLGLRLAGTLGRYWHLSGQWREGVDWLTAALSCVDCGKDALARALVSLGVLYQALEEGEVALVYLTRGLDLWREEQKTAEIAWALFELGTALGSQGDYARARACLEESLASYRQLHDRWAVATVLNQLSAVESTCGNYTAAGRLLEESLPILRDLPGSSGGLAVALNLLGRILLGEGETARPIALFEEALELSKPDPRQEGQAWALLNLGLAHLAAGDLAAAEDTLQQTLRINCQLERKGGMMAAKEGLAAVAATRGNYATAEQLLADAAQLRVESGQLLSTYEEAVHARTVAAIAQAVG